MTAPANFVFNTSPPFLRPIPRQNLICFTIKFRIFATILNTKTSWLPADNQD